MRLLNKIRGAGNIEKGLRPQEYGRNFLSDDRGQTISFDSLDRWTAQKIVNEYGQALITASKLSRIRDLDPADEWEDNEGSTQHDNPCPAFSSKMTDKNLLPYPKDVIKKAIEFLLKEDKDPTHLEALRAGLLYLDDFA